MFVMAQRMHQPMHDIHAVVRHVLPKSARRWLGAHQRRVARWTAQRRAKRSLWRLTPISPQFGSDRGLPVDRYYIEAFLSRHSADVHGHVLEVADNRYTKELGGARVARSDILHVTSGNPDATVVADLARCDHILPDTFDCIIVTQTLQYVYDVRAAVRNLRRIVKPGGVVLVTIPGISQIIRYDMEHWGEHWRFTNLSAQRLFEEAGPWESLQIQVHGNILAATAFLHGLAAVELRREELDFHDPDYQVLITVRALKTRTAA
jgi:SAM-dependent methyltransferase